MKRKLLFIVGFAAINILLLYLHLFLFRTSMPALCLISIVPHLILLIVFPYRTLKS